MRQLAARNRLWFVIIAILSFAGIVLSAVSLQRHYAKSATEFCDLGQKFNCDIVNRSEYSEVQGIPVAAIGVLGYATLFFLSTFWNSGATTPNRLLVLSTLGLLFALRLTYVEAYALKTWCIVCVASQVAIFLITVVAIIVKFGSAKA